MLNLIGGLHYHSEAVDVGEILGAVEAIKGDIERL
jgi:hypothetical protein